MSAFGHNPDLPSGFVVNPRLDPAPSRGMLAQVQGAYGPWPGPEAARGTPAEEDLADQKVRRGPPGVVIPQFLPYIDEFTSGTGETQAMRLAYRKMLADANIKAALLGKLLSVAALDLKIHPADKKNRHDQHVAEFVRWTLVDQLGGPPRLMESVLLPGLVDGYSVCEKVLGDPQEKGKWAGKIPLIDLASIDVGNDLVPELDDRKRIVSYLGLRYNAGQHFAPALFTHWTHLGLFGQPTGMSDFRAAYRPFWICDTAWKLRLLMLQFRAGGLLIGKYQTDSVKPSLEAALKYAKTHGWLSIPAAAEIEVVNLAAGGSDVFEAAMKDAKHDMFLALNGAILQSVEGIANDAAGNSQVHQGEAEKRVWWLSTSLEGVLNGNGRTPGLIKDIVDLNFVVGDYPRAKLGSVDLNEVKARLEIYAGLQQLGVPLSASKVNEECDNEPPDPADPSDLLKAPTPPQPPGGMPGMGGPPQPGADPDKPDDGGGFEGFSEQDWVRSSGKRGGKRWTNIHTGRAVYGKDNPGRAARRAAKALAGGGQAHAGVMGRLASVGAASWDSLKKAGHAAEHVEHVAKQFVADKIGAAVAKLPRALQLPVVGAWKLVRLGSAAAFATYTAGQAAAERVAQESGASPEEAARLKKVCSVLDIAGAKAIPLTLEMIGLGHLAAPAAFVPFGSAAYLAYSTARRPLATLRAARKAVAAAAGKAAGVFRHAEAEADLSGLLDYLQAHAGPDADWADACLFAALDACPELAGALEAAEAAAGTPEAERFAEDAAGHQHKGAGEGGGQFTGTGGGHREKFKAALAARQKAAEARRAARESHQGAAQAARKARRAAFDGEKAAAGQSMEMFQSHADAMSDVANAIEADEGAEPEAFQAYLDMDAALVDLHQSETAADKKEVLAAVHEAADSLQYAPDATAAHKTAAAQVLAHVNQAGSALKQYAAHRRAMKGIRAGDVDRFAELDVEGEVAAFCERFDEEFERLHPRAKGKFAAVGAAAVGAAAKELRPADKPKGDGRTKAHADAMRAHFRKHRLADDLERSVADNDHERLHAALGEAVKHGHLKPAAAEALWKDVAAPEAEAPAKAAPGDHLGHVEGMLAEAKGRLASAVGKPGEVHAREAVQGLEDLRALMIGERGGSQPAPAPEAPKPTPPSPAPKPAAPANPPPFARHVLEAVKAHGGEHNLAPLGKIRSHLVKAGVLNRKDQDAGIQGARQAGYVTGSGLEGRHGVTEQELNDSHGTGADRIGYLSLRPDAPDLSPKPPPPPAPLPPPVNPADKTEQRLRENLKQSLETLRRWPNESSYMDDVQAAQGDLDHHLRTKAAAAPAAKALPSAPPNALELETASAKAAKAMKDAEHQIELLQRRTGRALRGAKTVSSPELDLLNAQLKKATDGYYESLRVKQQAYKDWHNRSLEAPAAPPEPKPAPAPPPEAPKPAAPPPHPAADHAAVVAAAVKQHAGPHNLASLVPVRKTLADQGITDRGQQDAAIQAARRAGHVTGSKWEGRHGVTPEQRAASHGKGDDEIGFLSTKQDAPEPPAAQPRPQKSAGPENPERPKPPATETTAAPHPAPAVPETPRVYGPPLRGTDAQVPFATAHRDRLLQAASDAMHKAVADLKAQGKPDVARQVVDAFARLGGNRDANFWLDNRYKKGVDLLREAWKEKWHGFGESWEEADPA